MSRKSRRQLIRNDVGGSYHLTARCVRRAFLLGDDPYTGANYDHRQDWVTERLMLLVANFAIDVSFQATLSNHVHLVVRTFPRLVARMSDVEVARRWLRVYPGKRVLDGNWIEPTEKQIKQLAADKKRIKKLRRRLSDVSWFMSALSEYIARRANEEDGVTGRFWEGRFKSRVIGGESAMLICGLYVDLNPVRAGLCSLPETATHTSLAYRLRERQAASTTACADSWLAEFTRDEINCFLDNVVSTSGKRPTDQGILPMAWEEYLKLLDGIGRIQRKGAGAIPEDVAPILERLGLNPDAVVQTVADFEQFGHYVAPPQSFPERAQELGVRFLHGVKAASRVFKD